MPYILLTKGYRTRVDQKDFERLSSMTWSASVQRGRVYAVSGNVGMHRLIMRTGTSMVGGERLVVNHLNGDTLDNRRRNLRVSTPSESVLLNREKYDRGTPGPHASRYRGVTWSRSGWVARLQRGGSRLYLGLFKNEEDAARAHEKAAMGE